MKHITTIALMLSLTAFAIVQERNCIPTCSRTKTAIKWTEEHRDGEIYLHAIQGGEKHEYILGNDYKTESWKAVNIFSNTNLSIRLNNGIYSTSGKSNGKQISRIVRSKGKLWYRNIAYSAGLILKNSKSVEYECSRPNNMKLHTVSATNKGSEKFDGENAIRIEVTPTGFTSAFWSYDHYFDTSSMMFVGHEGVDGASGTSETRTSVAKRK